MRIDSAARARRAVSIITLAAALTSIGAGANANAAATVKSMQKVSQARVGLATFEAVYRLVVKNGATPLTGAVAIVTATEPGTTIVQGTALVGDLAPHETVTTEDTVTLRVDHKLNPSINPHGQVWKVVEPACTDLADMVDSNELVVDGSTSAAVVAAEGNLPAYCRVDLLQHRAIRVSVGLPLSVNDGGNGGEVQGAWNGRIQNLGSAGVGGSLGSLGEPIAARMVGSVTDMGHSAAWCNAVNESGTPNSLLNCGPSGLGFILDSEGKFAYPWQKTDFTADSAIAQSEWALRLARLYYGRPAMRNYYTGCSQGGGQAMAVAMNAGHLFDGIVAGSPANQWGRLNAALLFPAVVVKDVIGLPAGLPPTKSAATIAEMIAACDANDGVVDGLVQEPRRCQYSATARICTGSSGESPTCLTPAEAAALDLMWDGPRTSSGQRLWGGWPRGAPLTAVLPNGNAPNVNFLNFMKIWVETNVDWDWTGMTLAPGPNSFEAEFEKSFVLHQGALNRETSDLDSFKARGGKLIMWNGLHDQTSANPFGVYTYFNRLVDRYGFAETQSFVHAYMFPGALHCGGLAPGSAPTPQPGAEAPGGTGSAAAGASRLFHVLQDWVERGLDPQYVVGSQSLAGGAVRTRRICKYPDEAVYVGSGSTDDHTNFVCHVNSAVPADLAEASRSNHDELR
jgi:feruloyl esterase